jgi:hypothetical protein
MVLGVDAMLYEVFKVVTYMKSIIHELPNACDVTRTKSYQNFTAPNTMYLEKEQSISRSNLQIHL